MDRLIFDKELAELRQMLLEARKNISQKIHETKHLNENRIKAKTSYQRALAKAKVKARSIAKTATDRTPTMINALAEIDEEVIKVRDDYDIKLAMHEQAEVELKNLDDEIKAIKKSMGTIETEMKSFG